MKEPLEHIWKLRGEYVYFLDPEEHLIDYDEEFLDYIKSNRLNKHNPRKLYFKEIDIGHLTALVVTENGRKYIIPSKHLRLYSELKCD